MVFDWVKAAAIIKQRGAQNAAAGLSEDWFWTGGDILKNGAPIERKNIHVYLASFWATPGLSIDGEIIPCFVMQRDWPDWNAHTYWPEEALAVLKEKP